MCPRSPTFPAGIGGWSPSCDRYLAQQPSLFTKTLWSAHLWEWPPAKALFLDFEMGRRSTPTILECRRSWKRPMRASNEQRCHSREIRNKERLAVPPSPPSVLKSTSFWHLFQVSRDLSEWLFWTGCAVAAQPVPRQGAGCPPTVPDKQCLGTLQLSPSFLRCRSVSAEYLSVCLCFDDVGCRKNPPCPRAHSSPSSTQEPSATEQAGVTIWGQCCFPCLCWVPLGPN